MTQSPEAPLARELGICYSAIALVTDYDTGLDGMPGVEPVSQAEVFGFFERNLELVRAMLFRALEAVPAERGCACVEGSNGVEPEGPPSS